MSNFRCVVVGVLACVAALSVAQTVEQFPPSITDHVVVGGRVQAIAVHPDPRIVVVAHQFGGLWKTKDGGLSWTLLTGLPAQQVKDVAYAGLGTTMVATVARDNWAQTRAGIWISTDGGMTWSKPPTANWPITDRVPQRGSAYGISVDFLHPRRIFVGTDFGIAMSTDEGRTWTHTEVERGPVDGDRRQGSMISVQTLPDLRCLALGRRGVYRLDSTGWSKIRTGDFTEGEGLIGNFRKMDPWAGDAAKVFILQNSTTLWAYDDAYRQFHSIGGLPPGGGTRGLFVASSRRSDGRTDLWVGAGVTLRRRTGASFADLLGTGAADWSQYGTGQHVHDDCGGMGLSSSKDVIMYGCDGGLFKPANPAITEWTKAAAPGSGMNSLQITDLAGTEYPSHPTSLYFSTQDNNVWASPDAGRTWPASDCAEGFHIEAPAWEAGPAKAHIAYGKFGCGPSRNMFAGGNLLNQRGVPDVDVAGNPLPAMSEAFLVSPGKWVRFQLVSESNPGVFVSKNNGATWRKRADVQLEVRGKFKSAGSESAPVVYAAFRGMDRDRIGLIRFDSNVLNGTGAAVSKGEADLILLPEGGSLGQRHTEFDHGAVYGVNPVDPNHIIAPDIVNGVIKVTKNGGRTWTTDAALTRLATKEGALLLWDGDMTRMQVTTIAFDPHRPQRILVGTRDTGIIWSNDNGRSWSQIPNSEQILYITGFFATTGNTLYVSSYGRGLWRLDVRYRGVRFPPNVINASTSLRPASEEKRITGAFDYGDKDVILVVGGSINGLELSATGDLQRVTVTPGSTFLRYKSGARIFPSIPVEHRAVGAGFAQSKGAAAAVRNKEHVNALVVRDRKLVAVMSSAGALTDHERIPAVRKALMPLPRRRFAEGPYLFAGTSARIAGVPILGIDNVLVVRVTGLKEASTYELAIDGRVVKKAVRLSSASRWIDRIRVPAGLDHGSHTVELIGPGERSMFSTGRLPAAKLRTSFVKATIDEGEHEKHEHGSAAG